MTGDHASDLAARLTLEAFDLFNTTFQSITRRAKRRFEEQDWSGARSDAAERLDAYENALNHASEQLEFAFGGWAREQSLWAAAKSSFERRVSHRYDVERAETFFNSVTRTMLKTVGVNRDVEFFYLHPRVTHPQPGPAVYRTYPQGTDTRTRMKRVLEDLSFRAGFEDLERDAGLVAREVDLYLWPVVRLDKEYRIEILRSVFYRNKEAYVVGRAVIGERMIPIIIPLTNGDSGIRVETVLLHEGEASILFSFAYSYFLVDVERYDLLIQFIRSILPEADLAEVYNSLGYNRHGKTEFYRDLHRFVHVSREQFVIAPGLEGAVMIAFTLPNYDFVFKVIKDRPCFLRSMNDTPKAIRKDQVRQQYDFVSHRDRAGRMVDTQEFENLRFKKRRFDETLLHEFIVAAKEDVAISEEYVVIQHAYVQRKVLPLPLYFRHERDPESLRRVLIDFGYFLKDIAASGVFPTDLFNLWNYGVTHWGRVVLFDYDDVLPIERIRFREKPSPRDEFEENEPEENWIVATQEDFFMDEIDRYSGIPNPLKAVFKAVHGDLYTLKFWNELTERLNRGDVFDVIPYDRKKRFHAAMHEEEVSESERFRD
jgi:isocitrate dehydrogenase kinase/phosphatase